MSSSSTSAPLTIGQARKLVADLLTPNPVIYWVDFLVSVTIAYGAAGVFLHVNPVGAAWPPAWYQIVCFVIAGIALFRVALFMHEIVHFRQGEMKGFTVVWNIVAGIPMMVPSFLYKSHLAHHNTHLYGTANDGEYLPLGVARIRNILGFLGQILLLPAIVGFRFMILTPISFLHPKLRRLVLERASSFVINFSYRRAIPENAPRVAWAALDIACCLRTWLIFSFALPFINEFQAFMGSTIELSWERLPKVYCLAMLTVGLNHVRTLVAHRYRSAGQKMSFVDQFDDSVNVAGRTPLVVLMFPVGLQYHALHHLFPSIPYHNLAIAHRRLIDRLPADSAYQRSTYATFWAALGDLIRSSRSACANPPPGCDEWYARRREDIHPVLPNIGYEPSGPDVAAGGD